MTNKEQDVQHYHKIIDQKQVSLNSHRQFHSFCDKGLRFDAFVRCVWENNSRVCVWCCERRQKANNSPHGVTHTPHTHSGQIRNNPPPASASFSGADKNSRSLLIDLGHTKTTLVWMQGDGVGIFPFDFLRPRTPAAGITYTTQTHHQIFVDFLPFFCLRAVKRFQHGARALYSV